MGIAVKDIDWEALKAEIEASDTIEDECGNEVKSVYLGSVFSLSPSGKYYTPFASSNVSEKEAEEDEDWYEKLKEAAHENGLFIESGIGDPTDIIISKLIKEREGGETCRNGHKPQKRWKACLNK
jgi:hypothetical protein